jgi:hypothetical protein
VRPIVETPQHQQNATFHWRVARLLLQARTVTFAVSFLSIQHKQNWIPIIFCFAKKKKKKGGELGREKGEYRSKWNTNNREKVEKYVRRGDTLMPMSLGSLYFLSI